MDVDNWTTTTQQQTTRRAELNTLSKQCDLGESDLGESCMGLEFIHICRHHYPLLSYLLSYFVKII